MTTLNENFHDGGFMVSKAPKTLSKDIITIASGAGVVQAGTVLGKLLSTTSAPVYAATGGNTGNFTCSAVTNSGPASVGAYKVEFISATVFNVFDPNGELVGEGHTGVAFSGEGLGFTITAGGTPAVVGDSATITVSANANAAKYVPFDPTAADGRQTAAAINYGYVDATSADQSATGVMRDCEVNSSELVWGANVTTTPQKTAALASLAAQGVIAR